MADSNQVVVEGRLAYPHIATEGKYGYAADFVVDKKDPTVAAIKKRISAIIKNDLNGKKPALNKMKMTPAEEKFGDSFSDCVRIQTSSNEPILMFNAAGKVTDDESKFASGDHVKALLVFTGYVHPEYGPGISCFCNGIQFVGKGDGPIGSSRPSAESVAAHFEPIAGAADEEDDAEKTEADSFFNS